MCDVESSISLFYWANVRGPVTLHSWVNPKKSTAVDNDTVQSICKHVLQGELSCIRSDTKMRYKFNTVPSLNICAVSALFTAPSLCPPLSRKHTRDSDRLTMYSLSLLLPHYSIPHYTLLHPTFCHFLFQCASSIRSTLFNTTEIKSSADFLSPYLVSKLTPDVYRLLSSLSYLWSPVPLPFGFDDSALGMAFGSHQIESISLLLTSFLSTGSVVFYGKHKDSLEQWCCSMLMFLGHDYQKLLCSGLRSSFCPGLLVQAVNEIPVDFGRLVIQPITIAKVEVNHKNEPVITSLRQTPLLPYFRQNSPFFLAPEGTVINEENNEKEIPIMTLSKSHIDVEVFSFVSQILKLPTPYRPQFLVGWLRYQWRKAFALVLELKSYKESRENEESSTFKITASHLLLSMAEQLAVNAWEAYDSSMSLQAFELLSEL
ncbi:hypothetical protein P9112_004563 [Eukaryota sp. TZLM1-RC]